jgi:hypothetical protein
MDMLKGSLIDKTTLMVIGEISGEPVGHISEYPALYESITSIEAGPNTGLEGDVNVIFIGEVGCPICGTSSKLGYVCADNPMWSVTFCPEEGIVWAEDPIITH